MPLRDQIATPDRKRRYVRTLFENIADRYDLITGLLSYGRDRRWKARLIALAGPGPSDRVLDLATGTGDVAFAAAARSAKVVGLDFAARMIAIAQRKRGRGRNPAFILGDMCALPFASASFDLVTTSYGLRNVPDLTGAIDEMWRVLKPSGAALSLDFNRPPNRLIRSVYFTYLNAVGGAVGWLLHRDPDTYRYIPASLRDYPGAEAVAQLMRERGFSTVHHYPVLGGLMAIHQAIK